MADLRYRVGIGFESQTEFVDGRIYGWALYGACLYVLSCQVVCSHRLLLSQEVHLAEVCQQGMCTTSVSFTSPNGHGVDALLC